MFDTWVSRRLSGWVLATALAVVALGCGDSEVAPSVEAGGVLVLAPETPDPAVERQLQAAMSRYLPTLGGVEPKLQRLPAGEGAQILATAAKERAGLVIVVDAHRLARDIVDEARLSKLDGSAFSLVTRDEGDWPNKLGDRGATIIYSAGVTKLSAQYALYELLRRLGARFYHPEDEYLPKNPASIVRERARTPTVVAARDKDGTASDDYQPDFNERSYTFHGAHPLEHLEAFSDGNHPIDEAVHVNDWIIKNRGNRFRGAGRGVSDAPARQRRVDELEALRVLLGFPRGAGITLHNQQQGGNAVVDRNSSVPPKEQIESYVRKQLEAVPDAFEFGVHFGPTEFTTTPDQETVQWVDWAGQQALALKPELRVVVNDHITGSQATDNYPDLGCPSGTNAKGTVDYYDLAFHSDSRFAAKVHTVMFYALEGPAQVYNQKSFAHKLCLMEKASAAGRPLLWFPEGAWWLSFDNTIPVYLPLYIWTRYRDVELLSPLLEKNGGTLYGHRMFNSGHAWGYWQQDYAVGLLHWKADVGYAAILDEIFDPLCEPSAWKTGCAAKTEAKTVLEELIAHQKSAYIYTKDYRLRPGGLFAYMSGEDPADELGAATGLEFQPVRVSFLQVARWGKDELAHFRKTDWAAFSKWQDLHTDWLARLKKVDADVPEAGKPWLAEVIDGVEINLLRAQQTAQLYDAVLTYRETQLDNEAKLAIDPNAQVPDPKTVALPKLQAAAATLKAAEVVIKRREAAYRYPAAQMNGGGFTAQTAMPNGTTYPWRVHTKTHYLSYWNNRHEAAQQLLDGAAGGNELVLDPVFATPGTAVQLSWPAIGGLVGEVTIGASTKLDQTSKSYDPGSGEGYFPVAAKLTIGGTELSYAGGVVRSALLTRTPAKGLVLSQPTSTLAQSVLNTLFPPLSWAVLGGSEAGLVFAPDLAADGHPSFRYVVATRFAAPPTTSFSTEPTTFDLPIPDPGSKTPALLLELSDVVLSGNLASDGNLDASVLIKGKMSLVDLVDALVVLAGFDEKGAKAMIASILGLPSSNLPARLDFEGTLAIEAPTP